MKKIICVMVCILMFILGACSTVIAKADGQMNPIKIWFQNENNFNQTWMVVDESTGVNYIVVSTYDSRGGIAITPRLNPDGTLYVSR